MTTIDRRDPQPGQADRITSMAQALRNSFGDQAIVVAERQVAAATGALREDWIAILEHMRR